MEFNQNEPVTEEVINALKNASFMTFAEEENVTISKNEYKDLLIAKGKAEALEKTLSPNSPEESDSGFEVSLHFDDEKINKRTQLILKDYFSNPQKLLIRELKYCAKRPAAPIETYSIKGISSLIRSEEQLEFWITIPIETMYARGKLVRMSGCNVSILVEGVPALKMTGSYANLVIKRSD